MLSDRHPRRGRLDMRRAVILFAAIVGAAALASTAGANFGGPQLAPSQCGAGKPVLDVSHAGVNTSIRASTGTAHPTTPARDRGLEVQGDDVLRDRQVRGRLPDVPRRALTGCRAAVHEHGGRRLRRRLPGDDHGHARPGSNPTRGFLDVEDYQCNSSGTCASPFSWSRRTSRRATASPTTGGAGTTRRPTTELDERDRRQLRRHPP